MAKHIQNAVKFGVPVVVAINKFAYVQITALYWFLRSDSDAELEAIRVAALEAGADAAVPSFHWGEGGKGALELANAVVETCNADKQSFRYLYDLNSSIEEKVGIIAREIYGADGIELSEEATKKVALYDKQVFALYLDARLISRDLDICLSVLQKLSILSPQMQMPRECLQGLKSPFEICGYLEEPDLLSCWQAICRPFQDSARDRIIITLT
jgi:hypothetical protein